MTETIWLDDTFHVEVGSAAHTEYLREHPDADVRPADEKPKTKKAASKKQAEAE